ncbi:MAG: hypothetical protein M3505_03305 [Verrucomicrobiota bacterium]|nr:hypothetical protein [Verrucomicrobiota bacterium]
MKTLFSSMVLAAAAMHVGAAADNLPNANPFARYEAMMNKSPFAVATAVAPPVAAPNFAKDLYIANAARFVDEGVVTLTSGTDKNLKEYLSTKGPNSNGYSVSNIEWSDRVGQTRVTILKDGQFATLTFNQALITQPIAGQQPPLPGMPSVPGQIAQQPPFPNNSGVVAPNLFPNPPIRPAPIPTLPTPPPRIRGVIQRPAVAMPTPVPEPQSSDEEDE